jgi:hypothetical protein
MLKTKQSWAFTTRQLCSCIGDGIRKLASGPFWLYVPDFDWAEVEARLGSGPSFAHLVPEDTSAAAAADGTCSVEDLVIKYLEVAREDLSTEVPLTSYGLDSLSAARLALALRSFVTLTQMQLLGDMSINDIYHYAETSEDSSKTQEVTAGGLVPLCDWSSFYESGHSVVKVFDNDTDIPLILMHGTSGNGRVSGFMHLGTIKLTCPMCRHSLLCRCPFPRLSGSSKPPLRHHSSRWTLSVRSTARRLRRPARTARTASACTVRPR